MATTHRHKLTASLTKEPGGYVAQCLEVDVVSQGQTREEALANLKEALELYFEAEPEAALPAPVTVENIEFDHPSD